jgi:isoleucyl-tRNA synthetase
MRASDGKPHADDEIKSKLGTLWNCYSFYVTYAGADNVTPASLASVALLDRDELDRWITSKFQRLVAKARDHLESCKSHLLMEAFEKHLDDLSNWWLRRSRRRFWDEGNSPAKRAAFATLYEQLTGLCTLIAPVLPFLSEEIWRNVSGAQGDESVHLQPYPEVDDSKLDGALESRIDTVLRFKNLGLSLRGASKVKVRQPLATLSVFPADANERAALENTSLRDQLLDELNVKSLTLLESVPDNVKETAKPNFRTVGKKAGKSMKAVQQHLAGVAASDVRDALAKGTYTVDVDGVTIELEPEDVQFDAQGPEGIVFAFDRGAFASLDTRVTPELEREGLARDFIRAVQSARKDLNLAITDRIKVSWSGGDDATQTALTEWAKHIGAETLADTVAQGEASGGSEVKVGNATVMVAVAKA